MVVCVFSIKFWGEYNITCMWYVMYEKTLQKNQALPKLDCPKNKNIGIPRVNLVFIIEFCNSKIIFEVYSVFHTMSHFHNRILIYISTLKSFSFFSHSARRFVNLTFCQMTKLLKLSSTCLSFEFPFQLCRLYWSLTSILNISIISRDLVC